MDISKHGIQMIKKYEGFRSKAYKAIPSEKYYTIGYGHYGKDVAAGMTVTVTQAEKLLIQDCKSLIKFLNDFNKKNKCAFSQNQFDALLSFGYNLGKGNLEKLLTVNTNNWDAAGKLKVANAMLLYSNAGGKFLRGLYNRRKSEREVFLTPTNKSTWIF